MDPNSLRNFKDFLQVYNGMSEMCFLRCVQTFNDRQLTDEEVGCVNVCARKNINVNHKVMQVYMEVQPIIVQQRVDEMNTKAEAAQAKAEATQEKVKADTESVQAESTQVESINT